VRPCHCSTTGSVCTPPRDTQLHTPYNCVPPAFLPRAPALPRLVALPTTHTYSVELQRTHSYPLPQPLRQHLCLHMGQPDRIPAVRCFAGLTRTINAVHLRTFRHMALACHFAIADTPRATMPRRDWTCVSSRGTVACAHRSCCDTPFARPHQPRISCHPRLHDRAARYHAAARTLHSGHSSASYFWARELRTARSGHRRIHSNAPPTAAHLPLASLLNMLNVRCCAAVIRLYGCT